MNEEEVVRHGLVSCLMDKLASYPDISDFLAGLFKVAAEPVGLPSEYHLRKPNRPLFGGIISGKELSGSAHRAARVPEMQARLLKEKALSTAGWMIPATLAAGVAGTAGFLGARRLGGGFGTALGTGGMLGSVAPLAFTAMSPQHRTTARETMLGTFR